jgi:hypothetical protein
MLAASFIEPGVLSTVGLVAPPVVLRRIPNAAMSRRPGLSRREDFFGATLPAG